MELSCECPSVLGSRRRKILSKSQVATSRDDLHLVAIVLKAGFQLVIRIGIVLHSWSKSWLWKISITPGCKHLSFRKSAVCIIYLLNRNLVSVKENPNLKNSFLHGFAYKWGTLTVHMFGN